MTPENSTLVFALLTEPATQITKAQGKLRELTIAWSRYGYHGEIIEDESIDNVLNTASQQGYGYCLLQRAGHVIDEQWYLTHWNREGFHKGIKRLISSEDFLVAGQWYISEAQCIGLKTDCLLVNLTHYQTCKKPPFGTADGIVRNMLGFEQTATTGRLSSSCHLSEVPCDNSGWNMVQSSFTHGLPVISFSADINNNRFDLMDSNNSDMFYQSFGRAVDEIEESNLFSCTQKTFFNRIKKQIQFAPKGAFLLNIESYRDLVPTSHHQPLDALFSVAAGFKPYRILHTQGFHRNTQIVLFDYSQQALDIRKTIVDEWNGENFPAFVRYLFQRFPSTDVFYQLWHNTTPETLNWNDMEILWKMELEQWGGADNFKNAWQEYAKLPHLYLHCDLLKEQQQLLSLIAQHKNTFIWWSNLFFTIYGHWHYSAAQRKTIYIDWINALANTAPNCLINGADHNNIAINGISAAQYCTLFNPTSNDELKPQYIHQVDLLF